MTLSDNKCFLMIFASLLSYSTSAKPNNNQCGLLFLTITASQMRLQVNWDFNNCDNSPDKIELYESQANTKMVKKLVTFNISTEEGAGFRTSEVTFKYQNYFPCYWYPNETHNPCVDYCYPYFLRSFKRGRAIDSSCLKINPRWMEDFGQMRIGEMVIPGAYMAGTTSVRGSTNKAQHYCYQRFHFWSNLVFGIRYFDLSVGVKGKRFYLFNEQVACDSLSYNLKLLDTFLKKAKREVVILDFRNFVNFKVDNHRKLIDLLTATFEKNIAPPYITRHKFGPKLEELWRIQKRVIINYRHKETRTVYDFLWDDIKVKEAKVGTKKELRDFICGQNAGHRSTKMSSLVMAVQPTLQQTLKYNLRKRSDRINPFINEWLSSCKIKETINVATTAYVNGNNFVDIALEENKKRNCKLKSH